MPVQSCFFQFRPWINYKINRRNLQISAKKFYYIDEQTQNAAPPLTNEQLYAIGRTAENYVKSNISQIKTLALPELIPQAMQMLKEAWGEELVERVEREK